MAKRRKRQQGGPAESLSYTHRAFLPYVTALGQLALAWNGLHEMLAFLFCSVMGGGYTNQFLAIWHALKSDRAQREILLAATKNYVSGAVPPKFYEDIEWVCKRADALEDARNDALHSPLWAYQRGPDNIIVMPVTGLGHVRAQKLFDKHLLSEFRWCRDSAIALTHFAYDIDASLLDYMKPWPDRPQLPNRGRCREAKYQPRTKPPPPSRSSRE
jgi:hypothetical protein